MRKALSKIFLLCMACMICMQGVCLATIPDGNWLQFWKSKDDIFLVNNDFIQAEEHNGRKYLKAWGIGVNVHGAERFCFLNCLTIVDVENHKAIFFEFPTLLEKTGEFHKAMTAYTISENDFSSYDSPSDILHSVYENLLSWVEQNRPDVINEIRTHNLTAPPLPSSPQSTPGANTDASAAANIPSGSSEAIVGDIEYEVLESGAVKFNVRCLSTEHMDYYRDTYYIFTKPERFKDWPGTYMVGWLADDGTMLIDNFAGFSSAFDYDPKTQLFTFYWWEEGHAFGEWRNLTGELVVADPNSESQYHLRARLIDKNTIYEEHFMSNPQVKDGPPRTAYATTYKYIPYDAVPLKITELNLTSSYFTVEFRYSDGGIGSAGGQFDENKCVWLGEERRYWDDGNTTSGIEFGYPDEFNSRVDMMRAFLAVNGKIGAVFCDVDYNWPNK